MCQGGKRNMKKHPEFIARFIEACGTSEPAKIQRLLDISYQTAKNYLHGRLPHSDILILISNRTSYSIDWLLTGRGGKIIDGASAQDTTIHTGQIEVSVRRICVEVINEINGSHSAAQPKVVVLQSSELMSEKVMDAATTLTGRQP